MRMDEIQTRALHACGTKRIDRRPGVHPAWEYQVLTVTDPQDPEPEWIPIDVERTRDWPEDGWEVESA